jgi:multiple antibiotic resistance protein
MVSGVIDAVVNPFLLIYATLLPIVNPLGGAPIFLSMTRDIPRRSRHGLAASVSINSFGLLLGSLLVGSYVLGIFGITVPVLRVAGGMMVSALGWQLLNQRGDVIAEDRQEASAVARRGATPDSFYPLTMPLTVGPGAIAATITLGSQKPVAVETLRDLALIDSGAVAGLAAITATIYLCYRFAESIESVLGKAGTNVLVRLSAFILLCIGIKIVWSGASNLISTLHLS